MISICSTPKNNLTITEYNRVGDIAEIWDKYLPINHSLYSKNLEVLELTNPEGMKFKYLLIRIKDVLLGVVYLQHIKITQGHFNGTALDKPGLGWLKKIINNQFSDVLLCGNLFRIHFPGYYFKNPLDENLIFEILMDYLNSDKENKRFCGLLIKDCPKPLNEIGKFKPYHDDVTMELEIKENWQTFDDYKKSLSKKYKQRCSKIQKSFGSVDSREFSLQDITDNAEQIEKLYLNVALKQALRIGFVNATYFIELKKQHGDSFIFNGYYLDNKLIGISTHILYTDGAMEIHFIGLDYTYNESFSLYFNILFDGLKIAIDRKMKTLELGRTARVAKASLGALPVEMYNYIFLKKGIPSLAFSFFNSWFVKNIGEDWKARNPFTH